MAVAASISPTDSSQRSASMTALHPSPAAVTAWRHKLRRLAEAGREGVTPALTAPLLQEPR